MKIKIQLIKISKIIGIILVFLYVVLCSLIYFYQEKLIFVPTKLTADYKFDFKGNFEEINLKTIDGVSLNNLLFKADSTKGIIFYLHGNGGSLEGYGKQADFYTNLGYDIFMTDYRGYGKSEGSIKSESQLYQDNQMLYDELKKTYSEDNIIIVGYSLGGSMASKLASSNNPKYLILQAPYCGGEDYDTRPKESSNVPLEVKIAKLLPLNLLIRYTFKTNEFIKNCKMPVLIFHGDADDEIHYGSSIKLKENFKPEDKLILLEGEKHNTIGENPIYQKELKKLLKN
ncbi:alpha/beta fold hydrolase [Flavobacteriaceae bacterium KMM 6898]|nr:alpha/beta fold hydrolase [Flavobacteriaceae bacterium KMM 6898]